MCGIAGTVNRAYAARDLALLSHRGPDGERLTAFTVGTHRVHLGHSRLSIVDLSENGAQPMSLPGGGGCLTFNGAIYNHAGLRRETPTYPFRGHSDTETLLALFDKYGARCLDMLNGSFGLAYLDVRDRALYLARDAYGVKPVYWTASPAGFAFSSEVRALPGPREVNANHLATLLRLRYLPSPLTLWNGIWKLPPGHVLRLDLSSDHLSWTVSRYTSQMRRPQEDRPVQEHFEQTLEAAVSRQLMADVDIGVLLNGGLDSTLTAYFARKHYSGPLRSYSVGYDRSDVEDETNEAENIAEAFNLTHRTVRMTADVAYDTFEKIVEIVEEPIASPSMIPLYTLAKAASEDVKVVLSGQGADELSGGHPRYRAARVLQHVRRARLGGLGALALRAFGARRMAAAMSARNALSSYICLTELFSRADVIRLTGQDEEFLVPPYALEALTRGDLTNAFMELDAGANLPDELLMYTDKVTMHHSLECRAPFLDLELASVLSALPGNEKVGFFGAKRLQSRAAARLFPTVGLRHGKKGFQVPRRLWGGATSRIRELLQSPHSQIARFIDNAELRKVLSESDRGLRPDKQIFTLAVLAVWFEVNARASANPLTAAASVS